MADYQGLAIDITNLENWIHPKLDISVNRSVVDEPWNVSFNDP